MQKFDNVQTTLSGFDSRYERLMPSQFLAKLYLSEVEPLSLLTKHLAKNFVLRAVDRFFHRGFLCRVDRLRVAIYKDCIFGLISLSQTGSIGQKASMKLLLVALLLLSAACFPRAAFSEDLKTLSGKIYHSARVSRAEPDGVTYFFDGGAVKVPFTDLPEAVRRKYGYSPEKAAAFASQDDATQQRLAADRETQAAAERSRQAAAQRALQTAAEKAQQTAGTPYAPHESAVDRIRQAKPAPGRSGTPGAQILRVHGTVLQTLPEGVILTNWENWTVERDGSNYGANEMDTQLFVAGTPQTLIDGGRFDGVIYPAGIFRYTSVTGATKTIFRYAVSPELAVQIQSDQ